MTPSSTDIAANYYEACRGDIDAVRPWLADDLLVRRPMQNNNDADSFIETTRKNARLFADATHDRPTQVVERDEVVVLGRLSMGPAALPTAEYFKVAGVKIREIRLYFDRAPLGEPLHGK